LSVKLIRLSEASPKSCHPTPLEIWGMLQVVVLRNVHEINSTTKPDLAGSKENLPGQNQVWTLLLTCHVWF